MPGNQNLPTENINQVILRLLRLSSGTELDYQTYFEMIRKKLASHRMVSSKIPPEEDQLLRDELKRVSKLKDKGRFKVQEKKTKVSSTPPPGTPPRRAGSGGGGKPPTKPAPITKSPKGQISTERFFYQPRVEEVKVKDVTEKTVKVNKKNDPLYRIDKTLDSILKTLTDIDKENRKRSERERKDFEDKSRREKEKGLEARPFDNIKKAIKSMLKPFENIWDIIKNFIFNVILGRIVLKLLDWFSDPKNREKFQSIIRFLGDHWPTLLALYLRFGTGLGRFIGRLGGILIKGALRLGVLGAKLLARAGLKGAGKFAKVLGGRKAQAIATGIGIAADVAVTAGTAIGLKNVFGGEEKPKAQGLASGGYVRPRFPAFSGGGFNFKGMMSGASMGAMFGPLGMLLGGAFGSGKPQQMMSGFVSGEKGVDKVPAMLSDGEFVMSRGAVEKYGIDTLEAMNAAGGGTNKPKIINGKTYAAGGGGIGDIPLYGTYGTNPNDNTLRRAARTFRHFGSEEDLFKTFKKLNGVPDIGKMIGEDNLIRIFQGHSGGDDALDAIRRSVSDKLKAVNNPQSFTQSSRAAAGLTDLEKNLRLEEKISPRYAENLPKLNRPTPRPRVTRINPSRMLPAAGESSANVMRAAEKAARNVRAPIPASRAIVPYTGGGLARTGITGGLSESIPQIRTNMRVPGGFGGATLVGGLKSAGIEILANYLMQRGFDKVNAMIIAKKIDEGKKLTGDKKENYIERLRNVVDREERWQKGFGGIFDSIVGMGRESSSQKLSKSARLILEGIGSNAYQGGAIKGGYGLKKQAFKDMPKTQIMTDDKGRPFVGYKAMRGGKPVYVRGPQPGTGTSNPFEALGRMINPSAYKQSDAAAAQKKYQEASAGSIASLKARGASKMTIARRQAELKKGIKPLPRPRIKFENPSKGGAKTKSQLVGSGSPKAPSFSASHGKTNTASKTLGVNKK